MARPPPLLSRDDEARIVAAIRDAESGNRGEVRVHMERRCPSMHAYARARELFELLGMRATRDGTAVLLYVAVDDRSTGVFAGHGIHGAARPGFWQHVTDAVARGASRGDLVGGIVDALGRVGALLREHAPGEDTSGNELPDAVTTS